MRTLTVFVFVVLLTSFSPRGYTEDFSDDGDDDWSDSDDSGMGCSDSGDDDWEDDSSDDSWGGDSSDDSWSDDGWEDSGSEDDSCDWDDDDAWEDDDWGDGAYDDTTSESSGFGCSDAYEDEPADEWEEHPEYDYDDDTYDDDHEDWGGSGFGCSGPYLDHDSCRERCRDEHDHCMNLYGYCQSADAAVFDAGACPDCSEDYHDCVDRC